jgi:O-antigen ligase
MSKQKRKKHVSRNSSLETAVIFVLILLFAVLPLLYFPGRVASYVTSKQYFLIGTVDILAVLWLWLIIRDARYRLTKKNMLYLLPAGLFLLSMTVSAFIGVDPATSFFSTVESGTGLIVLYHIFLLACIAASVLRVQQKRFLNQLFRATFFASVLLAITTFFTGPNGLIDLHSQMLNESSGGAMMGNSLLAGAYFIFSVSITILLILGESKTWKKILYSIGLAIIIFSPIYFNVNIFKGIALSSSYGVLGQARIGAVALAIGLFVSLCIWWTTRKGKEWLRIVGIIGIVGVLITGAITVQKIASPNSSLHAFFVTESGNRIIDWQDSVQGIKERPLLGWGPENFHVLYQKYFNPIVFSPGRGNEAWALHPHNNIFEVLDNGGVIGFAFYLAMVAMLFIGLYRLHRRERIDAKTYALLTGMLIAFIIQQQMIYDSIVSYTMFFLMIAVVAGLSEHTDEQRPIAFHHDMQYAWSIAIAVLIFPAWVYGAYFPARKVEEMQRIGSANSDVRTSQYQHLFHSSGSYAIDTDPEFYTDPLFYSYFSQEEALKDNALYQQVASGELRSLFAAVDPLWQEHYYDYHLTLSLIQHRNLQFYLPGDPQALVESDAYAARAFLLSPTDPQIYTAYAQTLVYEKKVPEAKAMLAKALSLNPDYVSAQNFMKMLQ